MHTQKKTTTKTIIKAGEKNVVTEDTTPEPSDDEISPETTPPKQVAPKKRQPQNQQRKERKRVATEDATPNKKQKVEKNLK